jgi:hypothetical protein
LKKIINIILVIFLCGQGIAQDKLWSIGIEPGFDYYVIKAFTKDRAPYQSHEIRHNDYSFGISAQYQRSVGPVCVGGGIGISQRLTDGHLSNYLTIPQAFVSLELNNSIKRKLIGLRLTTGITKGGLNGHSEWFGRIALPFNIKRSNSPANVSIIPFCSIHGGETNPALFVITSHGSSNYTALTKYRTKTIGVKVSVQLNKLKTNPNKT